jgi:beta-mannosidase
MKHIELNGLWNVKGNDAYRLLPPDMHRVKEWMPAQVPGTIHTDLLAQKIIPDPFYRMNENDVQWIENLQWIYSRQFEIDALVLKERHIVLVAEGLDTYARILINGKQVAETADMFVEHRFDVKRYVKAGTNLIEIHLDSPVVRSKQLEKKHGVLQVALEPSRVYVRKAQYSFSWDWGPKLTTSGIWRPIYIEVSSGPILRNPFVRTVALKKNAATIEVSADIEHFHSPVTVWVNIQGHGYSRKIVKRATSSSIRFKVSIDNPHLWWPNGHGEQPLYVATLSLQASGRVTSEVIATFGIRTIQLFQKEDAEGKSFVIAVNGERIFCKGADWIPSDSFIPRIPDFTYERLLTMARDANMNMLRVWGGGIYEQDIFYNLCDKLGLLVWQDFMFACGEYPQTPWFLKLVKDEATKAITRLRNHPSLALWCGNNECEWLFCMENPDKTANDMRGAVIFRDVLPAIVKRLDGSRPYWRSSPFGTGFPNDESNGNHHQWSVWSAWKDYKEYEEDNTRFVTEFGFQAPANIRTWEEATLLDDRHPQHPVIEHHNKQVEGQERLFRFQAAHYTFPVNFEQFVYQGQLVQANALKTAIEHWRRRKFNTAGALFWQLNDCWPVSSWSVIDSALRPKASYYYARRFFAPILLTIKANGNMLEVWGTNDTMLGVAGELKVNVLSFTGESYSTMSRNVLLKPNSSRKLLDIPLSSIEPAKKYDSYIAVQLLKAGTTVGENRFFFAEPKHFRLPLPELTFSIEESNGLAVRLRVHTRAFAKDIRLEIENGDAQWSDNYFDLDAGTSKTILCTMSAPVEDFEKKVRMTSLQP